MHPYAESISAICIASAWCDGQITDVEKQALDRIHIHLGFSRAEVMHRIGEAVEHGPSGENIDIPCDRAMQTEYMRFALTVCLADGELSPHKVKFLAELANFLSIPKELLEEIKAQADSILQPRDQAAIQGAPSRIDALLPPKPITLSQNASGAPTQERDLAKEAQIRKPLAELLFQGQDYGGEVSLS